jgi:uncharacterized protein (UPF0335 family)
MSASNGKGQCFICGKEKIAYECKGCSKVFCFNHLAEHRQILSQQFDEIENDRDQFLQTIIQQKENPNENLLIQRIDKWENYSIEKIKQTAKECRQILIEHINQIENKLKELTEQIRNIRQENEFNEIDLNQLKIKLLKLTEQLNTPANISIGEDSTSLINNISVNISSGIVNSFYFLFIIFFILL